MSSDNSTAAFPPDNHYVDSVNLVSSTTIASTAYGIMVTLYLICCYFLQSQMSRQKERKLSLFLICYISAMFFFGTMYIVTTTQATAVSYVYHSDFPGGPSNYNNLVLFSAPVGVANTISYVFANWLADALLLWRLFVLYQGNQTYKTLIVAFPSLIYLGSLAMGLMFIIQTSVPNGSLWANGELNFALPYFVLSVSMSVIATGLMLWRVLSFKRRIQQVLGAGQSSPYTSVTAILVESCALYATFSLIFIVLFAINHPIQYVFLSALANVQIIAPLLVIFRVSQNKAWNKNTTERTLTSVHFDNLGKGSTGMHDNSSTVKMQTLHVSKSTTLIAHEDI